MSHEIFLPYHYIFNSLAAWQSLDAELQKSHLKIPFCAAQKHDAEKQDKGCYAAIWYLGQYLVHLQTFASIKNNKYLKAPPPAPMARNTEIWCSHLAPYIGNLE